MELDDAPDIGCDADVLPYIETVRQEVYLFPCLKTGNRSSGFHISSSFVDGWRKPGPLFSYLMVYFKLAFLAFS